MRDVRLRAVLTDDALSIEVRGSTAKPWNRTALWSTALQRVERPCVRCDGPIVAGSRAFAPITNANYRMLRLCFDCADRMKRAHARRCGEHPGMPECAFSTRCAPEAGEPGGLNDEENVA